LMPDLILENELIASTNHRNIKSISRK